MKTGAEYIASLRRMKPEVYAFGERIEDVTDHPLTRPHVNAAAITYELAHHPDYEDLMTTKSHLTGEKINRFTHIHQSTDDLVKKVKMLRLLAHVTGTCFQRCVGLDALNAIYTVTFEIDQKMGTDYHERFRKHLTRVQNEDLMSDGAMTDPKGNRSLSPKEQQDPDLYLRVVEERNDGIIVRGAKVHQTGAVNSHEIIVMPTRALNPESREYAISFSIPSDSKGLTYVFGRQANDTRRTENNSLDAGNVNYGQVGGEALVVFEDVLVPADRVFLSGETEYAGLLVERFASYHRQNYGGCKAGLCDIMIGAAALAAEHNGISQAAHIRDKISEMIHLTETLYGCAIACSAEGKPTPSGAYFVDPLLANVVKLNVTRNIYEVSRLSHDIAGGIVATLPSQKDFDHPRIGKYLEKYFRGDASFTTHERVRILRLLENMTGGTTLVESMHGAGSPQAQKVMMLRQGNLEYKKALAKVLSGIEESKLIAKIRGNGSTKR
jgi:4-hydroxybutyryl-CoA dehydratase/vinylacetyl-CoA-Delta-isomerase